MKTELVRFAYCYQILSICMIFAFKVRKPVGLKCFTSEGFDVRGFEGLRV